MRNGPHPQVLLADLALVVAVLIALVTGGSSLLSGGSLQAAIIKASVALVSVGVLGWAIAQAATPRWFRQQPPPARTTDLTAGQGVAPGERLPGADRP